jgi:hypothetical protein
MVPTNARTSWRDFHPNDGKADSDTQHDTKNWLTSELNSCFFAVVRLITMVHRSNDSFVIFYLAYLLAFIVCWC